MTRRPLRAALAGAAATALAALAFAGSAQADTTIPGLNGKLVYTTGANVFTGLGAPDARQLKCSTFPLPLNVLLAEDYFGILLPANVLDCTADIATINPDGTGEFNVTNNAVQDDAPAWLPQDGSKIAYQSLADQQSCTSQPKGLNLDPTCFWNLFSTTPDGSTVPTQLTGLTDDVVQSEEPSYSPDGTKIAFEALNPFFLELHPALRDSPVSAFVEDLNHFGQIIYTMPAGGENAGTPTALLPPEETGPVDKNTFVSDFQPTYSPDGTKIAFTRQTIEEVPTAAGSRVSGGQEFRFTTGIYVAPASGGSATPVESTEPCTVFLEVDGASTKAIAPRGAPLPCTWDSTPAWSPDGSKIAVTRDENPLSQILDPQPSTRGQVFTRTDDDIVVFNASDGSGEVNLSKVTEPSDCPPPGAKAENVCSFDVKPAWSPDGTKIAFFSNRDNTGLWPEFQCEEMEVASLCDDEIWTMNADGSSPFQVTNNDVNDINPDWQRIPPPPPTPPAAQPPATPSAVPPKVGVAGVRRACVASAFHVRFRVATTASSVKSVVVKLDGKRIKSTTKGSFTLTINAKKLKSGRHRLTITATDSAGHVTTTHKSFSVCKAAKPRRRAAPRFTG